MSETLGVKVSMSVSMEDDDEEELSCNLSKLIRQLRRLLLAGRNVGVHDDETSRKRMHRTAALVKRLMNVKMEMREK
jgi:hypothetical protein